MTDRNKLRELCEKATPGEWEYWTSNSMKRIVAETGGDVIWATRYSNYDGTPVMDEKQEGNLEFIAAANPSTVLELLDKIEALELKLALCETTKDADGRSPF